MAHDDVGVKAQGRVDAELAVGLGQQSGQPATLSGICQQKHHIVFLHQTLQLPNGLSAIPSLRKLSFNIMRVCFVRILLPSCRSRRRGRGR
jgi:hypothetical protein